MTETPAQNVAEAAMITTMPAETTAEAALEAAFGVAPAVDGTIPRATMTEGEIGIGLLRLSTKAGVVDRPADLR